MNEIGFRAFTDCSQLEEIDVPGSVRVIGAYAFMRCGALKSVTLHDGLREIGSWAFGDCNGLKSVAIPDSVREIGQFALGFRKASYQDRYVRGAYHSFISGFKINHNDNAAAIKYIAFHKLSVRLVRS
ncbi:MAG: leucine-rich repeat domain-containing protein [Clostridia bacterium]|nr:leucine-rich repeat domain-containing protein [Clostridia bacterium]